MSRLEDRQFEQFQRTGEAGALAKVFDHTAPELWRVAWYLSSGNAHRAEDALQSTFLTAIEERDIWDKRTGIAQALVPGPAIMVELPKK